MIYLLAIVFSVVVNLLDILFTFRILDMGGRELNPVVNYVLDRAGKKGAFALKFFVLFLLITIAVQGEMYAALVLAANFPVAVIALRNYKIMRQLDGGWG